MDIWTLLLITIFQFLNTTMTEWNPKSPLIRVDLPLKHSYNIFPDVGWSEKYQCKFYFDFWDKKSFITYAYCPDSDDEDRLCNYAEPFPRSNYDEQGKRLRATCPKTVEFDVLKVKNLLGQQSSCNDNGQTGHVYDFVYWFCEHGKADYKTAISVYEACYQENEKRIIYGTYTNPKPGLLRNPLLQDERNARFDLDTWAYHDDLLDHFRQNIRPLYQQSSQYVPRPVLPPEWLPFALQRKPLYYMTNIAAMDTNLKEGWEEFMNNLRDRLSTMNEPIKVTAGLLDVLKDEEGNNKYLGKINDEWEIPIANVWWVSIYKYQKIRRGVVIMMHNERYYANGGNPNISYYDDQCCSLDVCIAANIDHSLPDKEQYPHNFIYCCILGVMPDRFDNADLLIFPDA